MTKLQKIVSLAACALSVAIAPSALAVASITLTSGAVTTTIVDNGVGDLDLTIGSIEFNGGVGNFTTNLTIGTTKPLLGSDTQPILLLNSLDATSTSGGSLEILFSDTYTGPTAGSVNAEISGGTAGQVSFYTLAGANVLTELTNLTDLVNQKTTDKGTISESGPFTFSQKIVITHTGSGKKTTSIAARSAVPDGGATAALLGFSLLGLAYVRNRFALIKA